MFEHHVCNYVDWCVAIIREAVELMCISHEVENAVVFWKTLNFNEATSPVV